MDKRCMHVVETGDVMLNGPNVRHGKERKRSAECCSTGGLVRAILVNQTPRSLSHILRFLEMRDCHYGLAATYSEAFCLIQEQSCDLLIGLEPLPQGILASLKGALVDHQASFFCAQPVEDGCWWLPVFLRGELCFGTPALRPHEFAKLIDALVHEIQHRQIALEPSGEITTAPTLVAG